MLKWLQVISDTLSTANLIPFSSWWDSFSNKIASTAIIDRLIHHSKLFKITGAAYRLRLKNYKSENFKYTSFLNR
ncbi:TPA: ATP-binding protein [Staphylococcus pseudintermedius]